VPYSVGGGLSVPPAVVRVVVADNGAVLDVQGVAW